MTLTNSALAPVARIVVPPDAAQAQRLAADPARSVWVSANAGSGKTTVLTNRVIRLMLAGAEPSRILCVTFTKAAAANMQNRIFALLGEWVSLDDAGLAAAISALEGRPTSPAEVARARKLFAIAVETPGGLKIQTIHAFCEQLLHRFPFEADVPAHFTVLDDVQAAELREQAWRDLFTEAGRQPAGPLGQVLSRLLAEAGREELDQLVAAAGRKLPHVGPAAAPEVKFSSLGTLRAALGAPPGRSAADLDAEVLAKGLPRHDWPALIEALEKGSKTDGDLAECLTGATAASDEGACRECYEALFFTQAGKPRARTRWLTKGWRAANPELVTALEDEQDRLVALREQRLAAATAERSEALLTVARDLGTRFAAAKARHAALDFEDMIHAADRLLQRVSSAWVLYKLDQGLDHVLVDEAQDTSPAQWRIIRNLTAEFFTGEGQGTGVRTVFAVGDEKQSIYGFQGAAPLEFSAARQHYQRAAGDAGAAFSPVNLHLSFRTVDDVLSAVDKVFAIEAHHRSLAATAEPTIHTSARVGAPGLVEIWPPAEAEQAEEKPAWEPVDAAAPTSPPLRVAGRIARRIRQWLREGQRFADDGQPIGPGDVLVLVRTRGAFFDGIIAALKEEGVPVAGADRLALKDHVAVLDLLAAARVALLPQDDLTLAALLKSPLVGLADDDLVAIGAERGGRSLWSALRAAEAPRHREAAGMVAAIITLGAEATPSRFYQTLLSVLGGRQRLLARLGLDAEEAIGVFLATARAWEKINGGSLLGFLEAMAISDAQIKRDLDEAAGAVRVMTVHAAKGLEARIVFLADTFGSPVSNKDVPLFDLAGEDEPAPLLAWSPRSEADCEAVAEARQARKDHAFAEYRRLLYVAMTRARDRLYIAGFFGKQERAGPQGWYRMVEATLCSAGAALVDAEDGEGQVHQWRRTAPVAAPPAGPAPAFAVEPPEPHWLRRPLPPEPPVLPPLSPSRLSDAAGEAPRALPPASPLARLRGTAIHHLLQVLPAVPAGSQPGVAMRILALRFPRLDERSREQLMLAALDVLNDPAHAALFAAGSRAEVLLSGEIDTPRGRQPITGRVDRLLVTDAEVRIIDFKTGRPPADPAAIPPGMLAQLAAYRALLAQIHPGLPVTAGIVWTALPRLVMAEAGALDAALMRLTQS
jgi:ATP-dependent helicase/nuclease subunit A